MLASARRWVRIVEIGGFPEVTTPGRARAAARVVRFHDGVETGEPVEARLPIHPTLLPDIREALARDADAFAAITGLDDAGAYPDVAYVLIREPDGSVSIASDDCRWEDFYRDRLGQAFDGVMMSIVGVTDDREIRAALVPR